MKLSKLSSRASRCNLPRGQKMVANRPSLTPRSHMSVTVRQTKCTQPQIRSINTGKTAMMPRYNTSVHTRCPVSTYKSLAQKTPVKSLVQGQTRRRICTSHISFEKPKDTPFVSVDQRLNERKLRPIHDIYAKYGDIEYSKHKTLIGFNHSKGTDESPVKIVNNAFVAPCATLVGNVEIADQSSIWFGSTVRADNSLVRIGGWTNIQDGCYVSDVPYALSDEHDGSVIIGSYVTVGHSCKLIGCTIESETLVGMGSTVEEGATIQKNGMLGAHSVLKKGETIKSGQLWVGNPAQYVRDLKEMEIQDIQRSAQKYRDLSWDYIEEFIPYMGASKQADDMGYNVGWKERGYGWKERGYKESDYLKERDL